MHITMEPVIKSVTQTCSDQEVAVSLSQCSALVSACQSFGVEGYRVVDYTTNGFLSRYLPIRIPHAPMLVYRGEERVAKNCGIRLHVEKHFFFCWIGICVMNQKPSSQNTG